MATSDGTVSEGTLAERLGALPATLKVEEAAPLYRKSRSAMYRAVRRGDIPSIRVGGTLRILTFKVLEQLGVESTDG
jgi:excisionase family DNA binding protein